MRRIHKHDGAVLISVIGFAAAVLNVLLIYFVMATRIHASVNWEHHVMKRENAALQTEAVVKCWFCTSASEEGFIDPSEFDRGSEPKDDPYIDIPQEILQEIRNKNADIFIEASVIDQNYSDSFLTEAESMNIPRGMPSELLTEVEGESRDICFIKRYHIRITSAYSNEEGDPVVLSDNILVLRESSGTIKAIPIYTKKQ